MDLKRRKDEGAAVAALLSSGTWTEIIRPRLRAMWDEGIASANENVDSHPKMIQGLTRANTLGEFMDWLKAKAKDGDIDLAAPASAGPEISQEE